LTLEGSIGQGLAAMSIAASSEQLRRLAAHLELIAKWKPEGRETGKDWRPVHESNVRPGS
jgi:hypothetical protein